MTDLDPENGTVFSVDNLAIARVFHTIADLLEFKDQNPFKVRSYRLAAETIEDMHDSLPEIARRGGIANLQKLPGIGKTLSLQIVDIIRTGTAPALEELKKETPVTVLDLKRVSGIGLKTAQLLHREFGIQSLDDLRAFVEGQGLYSVPGLGEKTILRIKTSLARIAPE